MNKLSLKIWNNPVFAGALIGLITIFSCAFIFHLFPLFPVVHDEFSYLLSSDTFSHWRLTNPSHPLWIHFESFHINHIPTYSSKYPPLPGIVLSLGQIFAGNPIYAVWISLGLANFAMFWALRGWTSPKTAFFTSLFLAFQGKILFIWGHSYMGGAVPMLGSALVYGATPRLANNPNLKHTMLFGLGIGILALSRPYEGLLACIPPGIYIFRQFIFLKKLHLRLLITKTGLPLLIIISLFGSFFVLHNYKVTGNPLKLPYTVNNEHYSAVPMFIFQKPVKAPNYNHQIMKRFYTLEFNQPYIQRRTLTGFFHGLASKIVTYCWFYLGYCLTPFLIGLPNALRQNGFAFCFYSSLFFMIALAVEVYEFPHYASPFMFVFVLGFVYFVEAFRHFTFRKFQYGKMLVLVLVFFSLFENFYYGFSIVKKKVNSPMRKRWEISQKLNNQKPKNLIFVRYYDNHNSDEEWVYNSADIDSQKTIWARDMGQKKNKQISKYFKDRNILLVLPDENPPKVMPYSVEDNNYD